MKQEIYLGEKAASELSGFSVFTLRNMRHLRRGPAYLQIGRSIRYRLSDLTAFMEQRRIDPATLRGKAA
jgi:hypothetical protein